MSVRVPDDRLDEQEWRIANALSWVPSSYRDPAEADLAALVADLRAARADNQRLREAAQALRAGAVGNRSPDGYTVTVSRDAYAQIAALAEEPRA